MRPFHIVLASALCLTMLLSCQKEELQIASPAGNIKTRVSTGSATKSSLLSEEELTRTIVMDEDSLLLQEFVSDNLSQPCAGGCPDTKGTVVTSRNISTNYSTFGIECFLDNYDEIDCDPHNMPALTGDDQYIAGGGVSYDSTHSEWNLVNGSGNTYKWLWEMKHIFWSYAPQTHPGTYSYGSAGSRKTMTITDYVSPTAAADQKVLIVAYNYQQYGETQKTETLDIKFRHALADVYFDVSGVEDATVTKIEIIGAYSKGSCSVAGNDLSNTDVTKAFEWASQSTTATFSMTSTSDHFFMIPQTLPSTAKIRITLDGTTTKEKDFPATWLPGKYYKYKLTYDGAEYFFSLSSQSSSSTPVTSTTVSYGSQTSDNSHDIQIYSQKNSSNSDWDIKSYQVGNNTEVEVLESATSFTDGGLVVSEVTSGGQKKLTVMATKWTKQSVGTNSYWQNAGGTRKTDLGWSPESWSSKGVIDLSKLDYTEQTAYSTSNTMRTANCYIIRHAGTYKFPLVYGNAVDGSYAYNPTLSGSYTSYGLKPFKNHLDNNITSPFIENHSGCTAAGTPVVVWSDQANIITNLSIEGNTQTTGNYNASNVRYVQFTIPQDKICQNNAIIAIKDGTGSSAKTIWSWHIWTTNDPALLNSGIPVTNYSGTEFDFFPLNCLGWTDAGTYPGREDVKITLVQKGSDEEITITVTQPKSLEDDCSTGVHYQWGRKDPMPAKTGTVSGFDKSIITSGVTLGKAIQNPGIFYIKATSNWCSSNYYNLWSGGLCILVDRGLGSDTTTKTVYDPSPVGYKVPSISAFTGFSKDGKSHEAAGYFNAKGSYSNGLYFYTCKSSEVTSSTPTIFFPGAGWRDNRTDSNAGQLFMGNDYDGNYHSAYMWYSDPKMCYFAFKPSNILLTNNQYPTLGCSVRPVAE